MSRDWTEINRKIREMDSQIENLWAQCELDAEIRDAGIEIAKDQTRELLRKRDELLRQQKEIETGRITT